VALINSYSAQYKDILQTAWSKQPAENPMSSENGTYKTVKPWLSGKDP
jgi:hypothetical protein